MKKKVLKLVAIFLVCILTIFSFQFDKIIIFSRTSVELIKLNNSLASVSSNFYQNITTDITYKDVVYKKRDNTELKLDIYKSKKELKDGSPVIIYVFGNGWTSGDKTLPKEIATVVNVLRDYGYTIICTSYELMEDEIIFDKQVSDIKDTVRWVYKNKEKYNFDVDNIGIIGPSAGAQLSMVAAYSSEDSFIDDTTLSNYPSKVKYIIDLFGPTDLARINFSEAPKKVIKKIGLNNIDEISEKYSPINYVNNNMPRTLVIHSSNDNIVPYSTSQEFYEKAISYKNDFELYTIDGCTHYLENLSTVEAIKLYMKILNYILLNT